MRYTYSRWDGTHPIESVEADILMGAIADDVMSDEDLAKALRRVTTWGVSVEGEKLLPGLHDLLQDVRAKRRSELERYNLDSTFTDIEDRLRDIVQVEREGLESRLSAIASMPTEGGTERIGRSVLERRLERLDELASRGGSAVDGLAEYEFVDEGARARADALLESLRRHVLQRHFQSIERTLGALEGERLENFKEMVTALNQQLRNEQAGEPSSFAQFMETHGGHFPDAESLTDLLMDMQAQTWHTEALLSSMSPEMRASLEHTLGAVLRDEELRRQLGEMAEHLEVIGPFRPPRGYPFSGQEALTLEEAISLMHRMSDLDCLERTLKQAQESGDLGGIDDGLLSRIMGEAAASAADKLCRIADVLEEAGYIARGGQVVELTARGMHKLGEHALEEIFGHLQRGTFGDHPTTGRGVGGDRSDERKPYEHGDPFLLDLNQTLLNAVVRSAPARSVRLQVRDFEVFRTEHLTQSATVLMLDVSRSMPLRGCLVAARKVALALNSLIRTRFPRDKLYVVAFSDLARQVSPETLHRSSLGEYVYGTNMQHGFMLSRRLLGRHKQGTRQIILITDGEPTAHFEDDRIQFAYPPTLRTFQETLKEVHRCTREGIVINTFMLERSHFLADFVNQMTRINRGRAFFTSPERLGDYILVDYVEAKQTVQTVRKHRWVG